MNNLSETAQNGTNMDHESDVSKSDIEQGLGQIRVLETNDGLVVRHFVSARERFFSEYSKFAVKTAQASLEMCRVVYEAKKELASQDFLKFCNEIGRKGEDSTVRKYLKIGEKYDQFYQYSELLPNSWTSIYEITQLPSDVFEALVATDNSMANMTGDQIKLLKGNDSSTKPSTPDSSSVPLTMPSTNVKKSASSITNESEQSVDSDSTDTTVDAADGAFATHKTVSATCDAVSTDDEIADSSSDNEFAQQATSSLLERVSQNANLTVKTDDQDVVDKDEPYELIIRFNSRPSDNAAHAIVDALLSVFSKHRVDAKVIRANEQVL